MALRPRKFININSCPDQPQQQQQQHPFSLLNLIQSQSSTQTRPVKGFTVKSGEKEVSERVDGPVPAYPGPGEAPGPGLGEDVYQYQSQPADLSLHSEQFGDSSANLYYRQFDTGYFPAEPYSGDYQDFYSRSLYNYDERLYDGYQELAPYPPPPLLPPSNLSVGAAYVLVSPGGTPVGVNVSCPRGEPWVVQSPRADESRVIL